MKKLLFALALLALPALASAQVQYAAITYNLAATSYTYCTQAVTAAAPTCGATDDDGWIRLAHVGPGGYSAPATVVVSWLTKAATSLEWQVECSFIGGEPFIISTAESFTAAGSDALNIWAHNYDRCRVGLKLTTDSGDNSVTAYIVQK